MTPATTFAGRTVALFGLGGSGLATALALQAGGARVLACDDSTASMANARERGIETADLKTANWSDFAALVLSPGVPLTHPEPHWSVKLAKDAGVEIIGDIELFCRERDKIAPGAPFIAITGTNGKSTTTALIAHILREAGKDVQMGGNIGTAILSLEPPAKERFHVIEMSSFQIDLTPSLRPSVGVLLNISPDHLDRHGTMENYAAIKGRLLLQADHAILGIDDQHTLRLLEVRENEGLQVTRISACSLSPRQLMATSYTNWNVGVFAEGTRLIYASVDDKRYAPLKGEDIGSIVERVDLADLKEVRSLRGSHNAQNAAAAAAVAHYAGLTPRHIRAAIRTFPGLPHRMEEVGRRGKAIFVNDSKATNADSTEKALATFEHIYWILGGKAKDGGIVSLREYFPKVEKAYLIGAATDEFAETLDGQVRFARCGTLDKAVAAAAEDARSSGAIEPVILLSPACASYDQYPNFEVRGAHFRELVRALPGIEMKAQGS